MEKAHSAVMYHRKASVYKTRTIFSCNIFLHFYIVFLIVDCLIVIYRSVTSKPAQLLRTSQQLQLDRVAITGRTNTSL